MNTDDKGIAARAMQGFAMYPEIPAHAIGASVERGVVTLTGNVDSPAQRQSAIDSVRYLRGVTSTIDLIVVRPPGAAQTPEDATLASVLAGIAAALHREADGHARRIKVAVDGDEVTLTGFMPDWSTGQAVIDSVKAVAGVGEVIDRTSVDE